MKQTVAVVGLGKVGLPLAVQYASHGSLVLGCDISEAVVEAVNRSVSPVGGEAFLAERLADVHSRGLIRASIDTAAAVREADVVVVIVPMMVSPDHQVDYRAIDSATRAIGAGLRPGTLVVYETTLPVGTTRNRFGAILAEMSHLQPGTDFSLAFSPERIRTGRIFHDLETYPKVVGGIDDESTKRAAGFYRSVLDAPVMEVANAETAEMTKLMETAYRDVNIALANEFAVFAAERGIDVREAIAAANSQPQSSIHEPGVGVGGHCIPVYPYFLMQDAHAEELRLSRSAREINDGMADYAVSLLSRHLGDLRDRDVVILGLAYRADVKEAAFSSALGLMDSLQRVGANVLVQDPLFSDAEIERFGARPVSLDEIGRVDAMILQAYHTEYRMLPDSFFRQARVVLDGRGDFAIDQSALGETIVLSIGMPAPSSMVNRVGMPA
ncbi:MAG TPA: nucleotide sugar dehydrogenase [Thermomicrobiales bacterium]|nr:nucleotide sugar dehydrogenase [Thermomicrobiales bacterium]